MKKSPIPLLLFFLLYGCAGMPDNKSVEAGTPPLYGMIYDTMGNPVSGASITLDNLPSAVSDSCGRAILGNVSPGKHNLVITKKGFESNRMSIYFSNPGQVLYAVLIPIENILKSIGKSILKNTIEEVPTLIKRAEKINPENPELIYLKAVYLIKTGDYRRSIKALDTLLKIFPGNPYLILSRAQVLFYGMKQSKKALDTLRDIPNSMKMEDISSLKKIITLGNKENRGGVLK